MNLLVLEDEPLVAEKIISHIKSLRSSWTIHGPIPSTRETKDWLQLNPNPDLIVADIQLSDGISIDLLSQLKPASPVIFITAFDEYAIRAFKINSIDYILKPVDVHELDAAFKKFENRQPQFQSSSNLQALLDFLDQKKSKHTFKENFLITQGQHSQLIKQDDIAYFVKEDLVFLVNVDKKQYVTDHRSLDEIEELVDPTIYFRMNRQYLVQRKIIEGFKSNSNGTLTLMFKSQQHPSITVSREKASLFKKWFEQSYY
jgi:two-component system LytT family response regulator